MPSKIEISHRTIIFTILLVILLWILFQIRHIIIGLFVSLVLMTAINPAVDKMEKIKIPRVLAIVLIYLFIFSLFGVIIAGVIPPLIDQTQVLVSNAPKFIENIGILYLDQRILESQIQQLGSVPANLFKISVSLFTNLVAVLILFVITFYLLLERKNLNRYLHIWFGGDGEKRASEFIDEIEKKIGNWVRAQLISMAIITVLSYLGLRLLGIDFALPLALLAGILEIIPNIGPIVASVPAILTGLTISPIMALAVTALYFLIQQVEANFIYPYVTSKETGVKPLVTVVSLAIGFELGGILGAVLAIPMVLLLQVVASETMASDRFKRL